MSSALLAGAAPDVVVIGAGFAGLAAATALAGDGARVLVAEARPRAGGRATAHRDPVTGESIDNGQHVLAGCYDETLTFLRRVGALDTLHHPSGLRVAMIDGDGRHSTLALPPLPPPLHLLAGVLAWSALSLRDRWSLLGLTRAIAAGGRRGETVRQWLHRHGQSARLCQLFWEPLALAALNQSIDHASADMFVAVVGRMFQPGAGRRGTADADPATLLLPARPLDEIYVQPSARYLAARGSVLMTGAPARVVFAGAAVAGVRVRDAVVACRHVVAAVPWFALAETLPDPPAALHEMIAHAGMLASSPIVTVNLWFDRPLLDEPMLGFPGRTFQWAFDKRQLVGAAQSSLSLVSSGAAEVCARDNDALVALALAELRAALPHAAGASLRHAAVVRERRATFSLAPDAPPRPSTGTPVSGLVLAGDWIDTGLPATIEGAVVSGHRAARAIAPP